MRATKITVRTTRFQILVVLRLPTFGSNFATLIGITGKHQCSGYTLYESPYLANQKSRKLGVCGRKLEGNLATPNLIIILINIRENETIMFR